MITLLKRITRLSLLLFTLMICTPDAHSMDNDRGDTNITDVLTFTLAAYLISDYILENAQQLSPAGSLTAGVGSWLTGEGCEMLYKKAYAKCYGEPLRNFLGSSNVLGIEIDHQRLLRRAITLAAVFVYVYRLTR